MAGRFGLSNPNYRHGGYCGVFPNDPGVNLALRMQLQEKLRQVLRAMDQPLDERKPSPATPEEIRWVQAIQREWPEWAQDIMRGHGWNKAE